MPCYAQSCNCGQKYIVVTMCQPIDFCLKADIVMIAFDCQYRHNMNCHVMFLNAYLLNLYHHLFHQVQHLMCC